MARLNSETDDTATAAEAAASLRRIWTAAGVDEPVHSAVILGSGLRRAADDALAAGAVAVPYFRLAGMPTTRVAGHVGQFVRGGSRLNGCVLLQGRAHLYEGWSVSEVTFCVRVLQELGVRTLIITNAAGGIRRSLQPGDLMLVTGHLTLMDLSSVRGFGGQAEIIRTGRAIWSERLLRTAQQTLSTLRIHCGCYAMMCGPCYETPAEIRMLEFLGADAVGMSTVPEAIVASQLGIEVLGVSCITNAAAGLSPLPLDHGDVEDTAARIEEDFADWLQRLLLAFPAGDSDGHAERHGLK